MDTNRLAEIVLTNLALGQTNYYVHLFQIEMINELMLLKYYHNVVYIFAHTGPPCQSRKFHTFPIMRDRVCAL